jgi:hypothetical protein
VRAIRSRNAGDRVTLRVLRKSGELGLLGAELSSIERWRLNGGLAPVDEMAAWDEPSARPAADHEN